MEIHAIPLDQLKPWPKNPRQGRTDVLDLVASIKAEGLLQPLVVAPNGTGWDVIAGNRRLLALYALSEDEDAAYQPGTQVPCNVLPAGLDDDKLLEISLAENHVRVDMHPMDEAEAFAQLARDGKDLPGIAAAFSVSERFVKQRLVLAALPLKAREMFRKGEMKYEDAIAIARLQDPKLAAKALKLGKEFNGNFAGAANQLAEKVQRFYVKHARFEEPETFRTEEDLFDVDDDGKPAGPYFVDYTNAMECQALWVTGHIGDLQREGKWAFVIPRPKEDYYSSYRQAHDNDKQGVGLVVGIHPDGDIVENQVVSLKGERQKAKEKVKAERAKDEPVHAGELSHAFKVDLEELHRVAMAAFMARNPVVLGEWLDKLVTFAYAPENKNQDIKEATRKALGTVMELDTLAAKLAPRVKVNPAVLKKLGRQLDLSVIEWPRSMLKRLPRKQLEAEAKALKVKIAGEVTSTQLIERIWKARPKGWVPLYAKL